MKKKPAKRQERKALLPAWFDARVAGLVLLYGVQAFVVWKNERLGSFYDWLAIWNRWDAPHYLDIARMGYVSEGVEARWIVFYPLYPWLVRAASFLLRDELLAAFFVSGVASVAAGLLLYRLALADGEPEEVARASVFYLLIFPTAYFLHIGYTESLFLALALGAFLAARGRDWRTAGLLGFFAAMTRVNGLLLLLALLFEARAEYAEGGRRSRAEWAWLLLVPAGFGVYLFINWRVFGDPRAFLGTQDLYWYKSLTWPWVGIKETLKAVWGRAPSDAQMVGWQEFFFLLLGLGLTVWAWLRLRASYAVWMTCNWLLWTSTKFVLSVPRYTLVLFPAFILLARLRVSRPAWGAAVVVWSLLMLALFAARFSQGYWAF
jgi:Gpi18-like mannosyltransferase